MINSNLFNEPVGLLRRGAIESYNERRGTIRVRLNNSPLVSNSPAIEIPAPYGLFYNNGIFIGARPEPGTPVVVGQGSGGQYYFVSFLSENTNLVPNLNNNELLLQVNSKTKITLDKNNNINIGSNNIRDHINLNYNYKSSNFDGNFSFSQSARKIDGIIKREGPLNTNYDLSDRVDNDNYYPQYITIGLDPTAATNSNITGSDKNPAFVENRELIYEFQEKSEVLDDVSESEFYNNEGTNSFSSNFPNRKQSRADTLSLSLFSPNYLMETIKGTVVDIFGNILDLNRSVIPIGSENATIRLDQNDNKSKAFLRIKELERKSLAYHFEINSRKDLTGNNGQISLPDISSNEDYARNRSRFFFDIDKEGQFKLNVPASSNRGNIPLLSRYENYSSFNNEGDNPNNLIFREDRLDIFQDSFAAPKATPVNTGFEYSQERGSITIIDGDANGAPIDRITNAHIKHGTVYHDILQTCYAHQNNDFIDYQTGANTNITVDLTRIEELNNIVSDTIKISGDDANAGGRSGSINFDGSVEFNFGANTVDRQSIWLDTAGGIVGNIGRDKNGRSALLSMNGDVFMQIGGFGVVGDSRFVKQNNGHVGAVLDLRIMTSGGYTHMIRCDKDGITVMTPGNMSVHSKGNMKLSSDANIEIDCETLTLQGRMVQKIFGGSI